VHMSFRSFCFIWSCSNSYIICACCQLIVLH
jgi:hypothetical protein